MNREYHNTVQGLIDRILDNDNEQWSIVPVNKVNVGFINSTTKESFTMIVYYPTKRFIEYLKRSHKEE